MKIRKYDTKSKDSPVKLINEIPTENRHYFFRGWLDGDGHWGFNKQGEKMSGVRWTVAGTYDQDWTAIEDFCNNLGVSYRIVRGIVKNGRHSYVKVFGWETIAQLGDYIYQGYEKDGIGLSRKYKKYIDIKKKAQEVKKKREGIKKRKDFITAHPDMTYQEAARQLEVPTTVLHDLCTRMKIRLKHSTRP
jgi:hypothetical protein